MNPSIFEEIQQYEFAFPSTHRTQVANLILTSSVRPLHSAQVGYKVYVDHKKILIPKRIYWDMKTYSPPSDLNEVDRTILNCLLSRHHSGFIREKAVIHLLRSTHYWAAPYLISAVADYVLEILEVILAQFDTINHQHLIQCLTENPVYWKKTCDRIQSYWDCYYRDEFIHLETYPGHLIMDKINNLITKKT